MNARVVWTKRRPRRLGVAAVTMGLLALGSLALPRASAADSTAQPCAWLLRVSGDQVNAAFPDAAARYWVAQLPIPPGSHVEIAGRFPAARYLSFITYDPASRAIDGIHDSQILPDPGSTNPFLPGADRTVADRSYTVSVRNEQRPAAGAAPNTIYTSRPDDPTKTSTPTQMASVIYRVYEADQGLDITGGVGLPRLSLVTDDESVHQELPDCPDHSLPDTSAVTSGLAAAGQGPGNDSVPSTRLGGHNPPVWLRYTNAANGVAGAVVNNDRTGALWPPVQQATNQLPSGGFYENIDNAYITTTDTSAFGDILVFHAKAPTTPRTYLPTDTTMGTGQLRYWSMCSNTSTTQYLGCVKDDDVPLDGAGDYTIVVSTAANRPATATPSCGLQWLPKGPMPSAPIILRNMLPDPAFGQAVQDVPAQGQEQPTLGPYYPQGVYFAHASDFDTFVNSHGGCGSLVWPGSVQTYQQPGLPLVDK